MSNNYNLIMFDILSKFYKMYEKDPPNKDSFVYGSMHEGPSDFSETIELYGFDSLRYYLARSAPYKCNLYFDKKALINTNNHILINFENLVNRCYIMCVDVCSPNDPYVPPYKDDELENPIDIYKFTTDFNNYFTKFEIRKAILVLERVVGDSIAYIDYILMIKKYSGDKKYLEKYANKYLNLVYIFSHYYSLICPNLANYVVNEVLLEDFVSFNKLHLSILPHNKKLSKKDKISFVTKLQ